tara:strand:- start:255 stop:1253 length:999 start_codon:yes stop_codon:yes gene_type:complete
MKTSYKNFINSPKVNDHPIYLILGKPYHLQNEIEFKIISHFKKNNYTIKRFIVDTDFNLDVVKEEFENYSLFSEKKVILINVVSNTIPKKLSDYLLNHESNSDIAVILKLNSQSPSFKKNKIFSKIESKGCVIEIYELTGSNLIEWVKKKFIRNNIKYTEELFKKLIDKNEGNTSAISQELYKMSLLDIKDIGAYFDFIQKEHKFTEFDLVDSIIDCNLKKSLKILNYLRSIKSPEVYILFLINNEIKKVYSLVSELSPPPYIPSYKSIAYKKFSQNFSKEHLMNLLQYCYAIDKSIKLGINHTNIWQNFEILVTAFVMKKSLVRQSSTETA